MSAVIAGMGVVTPLAVGVASTFDALLDGQGSVSPITRFDARSFPVRIAAQGPVPDGVRAEPVPLAQAWLASCLDQALSTVDIGSFAPERVGVFLGAEAARPALDAIARTLLDGEEPSLEEAHAHAPWALTRWLADRVGARGPCATLSTACTSSAQAVGEALLAIRRGEVDVAIAGGADVLVHPLMLVGFARLGALSQRNDAPERASRPFDVDRDGFVLGEGAGLLVLVRPECTASAGLGRVLGYGGSSNAWRITDSPPDGRGAKASIQAALRDARLPVRAVSVVNAHGTSTRQNDQSEACGIRAALGHHADRAPVWGPKGALGHLVAACGVVEAALAVETVRRRISPATLNLERPDPGCPVRHIVGSPQRLDEGVAISNAFGFGGVNASLVLGPP